MTAICAVCTRNQSQTTLVCESCTTQVTNDLAEIGQRYSVLTARPGVGGDNAGRRAPGFESSPPANLSVISMRDIRDPRSVPSMLGRWATKVAIERRVTQPIGVPDIVAFLDRHFAWIAERGYVVSLVRDIRNLRHRLRPVTGEPGGSKPIGSCPNTLTEDDGVTTSECGAKLTAPLYGDTVECPSPRCGRRWHRREWMKLGQLLEAS